MRGNWFVFARKHVTALLPLLVASHASAAGVGLRWNECVADGGVPNRNFACNTNAGNLFLVSSFVLDQPLTSVHVNVSLELASASPTLPAWWDLAGCRVNTASTVSAATIGPIECVPLTGTTGVSGFVIGEQGPNTLRIEIGNSPFGPGLTIAAGPEYVAVPLQLSVLKSTGAGACGGCDVPACIVVRSISFSSGLQPPVLVLTQSLPEGGTNLATWQSSTPLAICPAATPTRRAVWGSVKALYR